MKIKKINITNFKGIRNLCVHLEGKNAMIYGYNASGKSTIVDAFMWVLFGKDSRNSANFGIKPVDKNGDVIEGLENDVTVEFEMLGGMFEFRKVQVENWKTPRGGIESVFAGHTIKYFINGVPQQEKSFKDKVKDICPEQIFRICTEPLYFSGELHWSQRRELLLEICQNISDEDVIRSNEKYKAIPEILGSNSIEDTKKILDTQAKKIQKEVKEIPVRIDEVQKSIPEVSINVEESKKTLEELEKNLVRISRGPSIFEEEILKVELSKKMLQNKAMQEKNAKINALQTSLNECCRRIASFEAEEILRDKKIGALTDEIDTITAHLPKVTEQWQLVYAGEFSMPVDKKCTACGQSLPEDQLKSAFEKNKANKLEIITKEGKALSERRAELQKEKDRSENKIEIFNSNKKYENDNLIAIEKDIEIESARNYFDEEYTMLAEKKASLVSQLEAIKNDDATPIEEESKRIKELIANIQEDLSKQKKADESLERINVLKNSLKKYVEESEEIKGKLGLLQEFIQTKISLLEEKINNRFSNVSFKLFKQHIEGGITEICEATYNGVAWGDLNTAARINAGLDIINVVAEHYAINPPIFIDNSESVCEFIKTKSQMILLNVSKDEQDKKMRIELFN